MTSEFGRGYAYCLGLFLAHAERLNETLKTYRQLREDPKTPPGLFSDNSAVSIWFYAAADHIFEFAARDKRSKAFKEKVLRLRLPMGEQLEATKEDYDWAIAEAKALLLEFDLKHGIKAVKGQWE